MSHLPTLIADLALILMSASIITLLFKWLKQPLVLGYIVAGLLAGPYVRIFPTVGDMENINTWAEIGVVFLLFALGLEFSFKKLMNVGSAAFITATTEVISMLLIGFMVGHLLGWSTMNSVFLGGMLSMSSTTIIIKAFDDLGLRSQRFTGIVFGTLVVEDLIAILMMVILSTMAVSKEFVGEELLMSVLKVAFFLILWFLVGIFILPFFLKKAKRLMNNETLLIVSLGLCLAMVVLATRTGFSAALGAFIMGSILAETVEAEHIEHIIQPVKDLFGAIFFVSVGMLVNPSVLLQYAWPVVIITLVTLVRVAREAAKHHLFVDFHGAFKPAGLEYKYPNVLSYEGVRGMEQMGGCRPDNSIYLPFMRNAVGAMDYTPGAMLSMQPEIYCSERPNSASIGTRAYQMALFVIFESGLQMMADNPTLYYRNDECTRYITQVPQTWDETIALKAKAGEYVIVAKRKGDKWYIGGMTNNRQQERTFELDFDFLKEGQSYRMTSFEDGVNANRQAMDYRKKEYTLKKGDKIIVRLARNGGFASVIE